MTKISRFNAAFFLALFLLFGYAAAQAQAPSLAPSDGYYMTVKTEFGNETFAVLRDGRIEEQFYFVPARPHVAIESSNGKNVPVFQLLTYQRAAEGNKLKQGGILQFSIQTGITQKTQEELLKLIEKEFPLKDKKKKHRLSPIPMKDAKITMYDFDGDLVSSAPVKEGIAPIFGNQQFPFMLNLTDLGSDVMEALCRGKGGVPVIIEYTFQGMTAAGGFKVEVNWDATYKHLSTDLKLKEEVGTAFMSSSLGANFSSVREKLISNSMIKVTSLANEAMPADKIDAAMEPILGLIAREMFSQISAPQQIPPAIAKEFAPSEPKKGPSAGSIKEAGDAISEAISGVSTAIPYVGLMTKALDMASQSKVDYGVSFALKDAKFVKKGKFTYTFDRQAIVDRRAAFGGPIGIGAFSKNIQDECITVLPAGNWESAYFLIPPVGDPEELGYKYISLTVTPMEGKRQINGLPSKVAMFNRKGDQMWRDRSEKEISMFLFPLKAVYASPSFKRKPEDFKFEVVVEVEPKSGHKIVTRSEVPMFNGDLAMSNVTELLSPVNISADCLSFGDGEDEIFLVKGQLKAGRQKFNFKFTENETSQGFLVPAAEKDLSIHAMQFISKKGKKINWQNNGKDLREISPDLDIMLFDSDWQEQPAEDSISGSPY